MTSGNLSSIAIWWFMTLWTNQLIYSLYWNLNDQKHAIIHPSLICLANDPQNQTILWTTHIRTKPSKFVCVCSMCSRYLHSSHWYLFIVRKWKNKPSEIYWIGFLSSLSFKTDNLEIYEHVEVFKTRNNKAMCQQQHRGKTPEQSSWVLKQTKSGRQFRKCQQLEMQIGSCGLVTGDHQRQVWQWCTRNTRNTGDTRDTWSDIILVTSVNSVSVTSHKLRTHVNIGSVLITQWTSN